MASVLVGSVSTILVTVTHSNPEKRRQQGRQAVSEGSVFKANAACRTACCVAPSSLDTLDSDQSGLAAMTCWIAG